MAHKLLAALYITAMIMAQDTPISPKPTPSSSDPSHKSIIQSLNRDIDALQHRVDSWNGRYIVLLGLSILVAAATLFAQFKTIRTARTLSDTQSRLDSEKDRELRSELSKRDERIAELTAATETSASELVKSTARIKEAEAEIAKSHAESRDAIARVSTAEAKVAEAQRGAAEASAKAESFRLDIAQSNERAAKAEARAAEAALALARLKAPRVLSSGALERMKRELTAFKGTPFDLYVSTDSESVALMNAMERALIDCGWEPAKAAGSILFAEKAAVIAASGFGVEVLEEDWEKFRLPATVLVGILNQSGLVMTINVSKRTTQNRGLIHILVGSKSLN
jgi:hypothetical protein